MAEPQKISMTSVKTADEQSIIQCPGCQTRFLVASSAFSEIEVPRFHCSRCDHIFSLAPDAVTAIAGLGPNRPPADTTPPADHDPLEPIAESALGEAFAEGEEAAAPRLAPPAAFIDDITDYPGNETRSTGPTRGLAIPRGLDRSVRASAPHEIEREEQIPLSFVQSTREPGASGANTATPAPPERSAPTAHRTATTSRGWRGLATVGLPLGATLLLLIAVSSWLGLRAEGDADLSHRLFPTAPQVPPVGTQLTATRFRRVTLNNGEAVYAVSGTVVNGAGQAVSDVVIEASVFGADGRTLATVQAPGALALARARLKSLSTVTIRELQSAPATRRQEISPGEREDFTIALPEFNPREARFFAARVHSVR